MRQIGLDCLTLPDVAPIDLITIAAQEGYAFVSLWVQPPALYAPMLAEPAMQQDIVRAVKDTGVTVGNLEVFNLNFEGPIADYERQLAFGASLGAQSATTINFGPPRPDMPERLAEFHVLSKKLGLKTYLEPISVGLTRTLEDGVALIEKAGVDAQLTVDFLHLIRTGGSADNIASLSLERIGHIQICDGPLEISDDRIGPESMADRLYPGDGEFPLSALIKVIPANASVGVEVPNLARLERGLTPRQRAREAMAAVRIVLDT